MVKRKKKSAGQRLGEALDAEGRGARAQLARDLDVDNSLITRWVDEERVPNTAQRIFIRKRYPKAGIALLDWDDDPTKGTAA